MKTKLVLYLSLMTALLLIFGCGKSGDHDEMHKEGASEQVESPLIRDFNVEVATLDENKDEKIFQCPMDWEVISDEAGTCPLCNMNLKEYSVADAQKNLEEHKSHEH